MKKYIVGKNTTTYSLNKTEKFNIISERAKTFLQSGRGFKGILVYLRTNEGFIPMIKVLDRNVKNVYYYPNQVKVAGNRENYSVPRAGESFNWGTVGQGRNPFRMQAGEMDGNIKTAPRVKEMMSGVGGYGFGVNTDPSFGYRGIGYGSYPNVSNYVYPNSNVTPSLPSYEDSYPQYSMIGGGNDGVTLNAGQSFDYGTMKQGANPFYVEGGEQDGNPITMPRVYSEVRGNSKKNKPKCDLGCTWNSSDKKCDCMFKSGSASNERGFGNWGLQAGDNFDYGTMNQGVNPFQMRAGEQDANPSTMPQSYSYANGEEKDELTQEEMDALHNSSDKKQNFWTWLQSDKAKNLAKDSVGIATALFNKNQQDKLEDKGQSPTDNGSNYEPMDDKEMDRQENTILGMHPLTFGIVAVGLIVGAVVVTSMVKKGNKGK
jgi:hypothetical protein